jgi:hypothetical protein
MKNSEFQNFLFYYIYRINIVISLRSATCPFSMIFADVSKT